MATATFAIASARKRPTHGRIGSVAGIGFALSLFGVAMLGIPDHATDRELVAWWADTGNQRCAVVSMHLFVFAGLAFLVLLTALRSHLLAAEGGAGEVTWLATSSGVVFVAMILLAAVSRGVLAFAALSPAHDQPLPGPDTLRYLPQIGYAATGTSGLLAAAVTMAATSWLAFRADAFGRWVAWISVLATLTIVGFTTALSAVFAIPALLLWALATSVALWRGQTEHHGKRG